MKCSNILVANILPADHPRPQVMGSKGQSSFFSEHGHVAYETKGNHECSNMVANILPCLTSVLAGNIRSRNSSLPLVSSKFFSRAQTNPTTTSSLRFTCVVNYDTSFYASAMTMAGALSVTPVRQYVHTYVHTY